MKGNLRYLIGFITGLAVAFIIPAKATPDTLESMKGTIVAQSGEFTDSSLRVLATCLKDSGFVTSTGGTSRPVPNNPDPNYRDGIVNANDCLLLREEGAIGNRIRCLSKGEPVQVILKDGNPITRQYGSDEFVFVISYKGDKGWAARDFLDY